MPVVVVALASAFANEGRAQTTAKCTGQSYREIATTAYGNPAFGEALAAFDRRQGETSCTVGRFVRLPTVVSHEMRLGQTVAQVANRFLRADNGENFLRTSNGLPSVGEPQPGTVIAVPMEIAIRLGTRPQADAARIFPDRDLEAIARYNGLKGAADLQPGSTLYVPWTARVRGTTAPPASPAPPISTAPPPPPTETGPSPSATVPPVGAAPFQAVWIALTANRDGFRHWQHARLVGPTACGTCHLPQADAPHRYQPVDAALCARCHKDVAPLGAGMRPYRLSLSFNHKQHLEKDGKVAAEGFSMGCAKCHRIDDARWEASQPKHPECVTCHNGAEYPPAVESACAGCHATEESLDGRRMGIALLGEHFRRSDRQDDIKFSHAPHVAALKPSAENVEGGCDRCHPSAREAETLEVIEPQRMGDCLQCHRGLEAQLQGELVALDRCRTCHIAADSAFRPLWTELIDKPISHTVSFRRKHARAAEVDDGVCQSCHIELNGANGEACSRCHDQMRPQSHTVRFREEPHGRAAVRRPDSCATCHQRDRCASCHEVAPRDHFPRAQFRLRHGRRARISTRRCQTCHLPAVDCARCHDVLAQ